MNKLAAVLALLFASSAFALEVVPTGGGDSKASGGSPMKELSGKQSSACQMMLCLSDPSGKSLPECKKPLSDYYDMKKSKRPGFLKNCPLVK